MKVSIRSMLMLLLAVLAVVGSNAENDMIADSVAEKRSLQTVSLTLIEY